MVGRLVGAASFSSSKPDMCSNNGRMQSIGQTLRSPSDPTNAEVVRPPRARGAYSKGIAEQAASGVLKQARQLKDELDGHPRLSSELQRVEDLIEEDAVLEEQTSDIVTPHVPVGSLPHMSFAVDEKWRRPLVDEARRGGHVSVVSQPQDMSRAKAVRPRVVSALPQYIGGDINALFYRF